MFKPLQILSLIAIPIIILLPIPNDTLTICPFFHLTGLPCPACGLGRSLIRIYHLDLLGALYYNPFGYIVVILQWSLIVTLFFPQLLDFAVRRYKLLKAIGFFFLLLFVIYGIIRILLHVLFQADSFFK